MGRKRERWSCNVNGCENIHAAKGYCATHYYQFGHSKKCIFDGCNNVHHARGYCAKHHGRFKTHGDPSIVKKRSHKIYESLEDFLLKNSKQENNGCWVWTAGKSRRGYGSAGSSKWGKKYKTSPAHRLSYICYKGEFDANLFVCHTCDNPSCINPDHLFLGTHTDNMADMWSKGRGNNKEGEQAPRSKLTKEQAVYVLKNIKIKSAEELANKLSVCRKTIQNVWNGATKYIEPELREEILNDRL